MRRARCCSVRPGMSRETVLHPADQRRVAKLQVARLHVDKI